MGLDQHQIETRLNIETPDLGAWSKSYCVGLDAAAQTLRLVLGRSRVAYSVVVNPLFRTQFYIFWLLFNHNFCYGFYPLFQNSCMM